MNVSEKRALVGTFGQGGQTVTGGAEICVTSFIAAVCAIYYQVLQIKVENLWGK
jgi:hypothetical protein